MLVTINEQEFKTHTLKIVGISQPQATVFNVKKSNVFIFIPYAIQEVKCIITDTVHSANLIVQTIIKRCTITTQTQGFDEKTGRNWYLELFVERFYIILYTLDQLSLVFSNCSADVWSNEEGIVPREDSKHLICITSSAKLVTQTCRDARLHAVNTLVISTHKILIVSQTK